MRYNKQPSITIVLRDYIQTPIENGRIQTDESIYVNLSGALFMDTLYLVEYFCNITDLNDASTITLTNKIWSNSHNLHDGGFGRRGVGSYKPGEHKNYKLMFFETTLRKGNESVKLVSNPVLYDFTEGVVKVSTPNIPGWPERVNFNYEQ